MLHQCNDHIDKNKEDGTHQAFAVLGVALIAMGEDVGAEMALRTFDHLVTAPKASQNIGLIPLV
jgi:26S proteasome regulatory subunit N1